ncbi:cytochrome P450 [Fennellomyces sp. T-0311]|nr:cytochrome P450 [Fennellomyces sp. T-0311]
MLVRRAFLLSLCLSLSLSSIMDYALLKEGAGIAASNLLDKVRGTSRADVEKAGKFAVVVVATYLAAMKIYGAFFGPLSQIPGPLQLKFYEMRYAPNIENPPGTAWRKIRAWYEQYGDVVRLGPNRLMISNKRMLRQIAITEDLPKGPRYSQYQKISTQTMLDTREKAFHRQRRRVISPAFSVKYLSSLEKYMADTVGSFIRRIDGDIGKAQCEDGYGEVDILNLFHLLSLDIIGETAFGETFHMLEGSDHWVPRTISKSLKAVAYMVSHPILSELLLSLPMISKILKPKEGLKSFMMKIIMRRLMGGAKARRNDILQILIDSQHANDHGDRLTAEAIANETILFLIVGSETTANSMGFLLIDLLKHPNALHALREEIDSIKMDEDQKLFRHEQLKDLPYLNAVINETMRLNGINVRGSERIADKDLVLDGHLFVPKGTILDCVFSNAHINPAYWPEPYKWIPERWLEGSNIPADTSAFFPFHIGSRNCIGKGFALQEMRLAIANLIKLYEFKIIPEQLAASDDRRWYGALGIHNNTFKVLMKRRVI